MTWKLKAHALALLSRLPGGRQAYHRLQRWAGTNGLNARRDLERAFELVDLAKEAGREIDGAFCVEIGTGWRPFVPYVLALAGARRVVTLDVNPWLTLSYALETWKSLEPFLGDIADRCGVPEYEVRDRYARVPADPESLSDLLTSSGIQYVYPGDARATGLSTSSVDLVVSSNVLEHIPPDIQAAIHAEVRRILKSTGVAVHRFNPQDHYATVDPQITHGNFLQYSRRQWNWLGGSGLAYHNRLRSRDYKEMFAAVGLEAVVCRERVDQRTLQAIQTGELRVHPEFARYSPEELAVDYMWVACRRPSRASASAAPLAPEEMHSLSLR